MPVIYKNYQLSMPLKLDLLVENEIIVELKAIDALLPVHEAQLVSYLRLTQRTLGLLINFNVVVLKSGVRRKVLNFGAAPSLSEVRRIAP